MSCLTAHAFLGTDMHRFMKQILSFVVILLSSIHAQARIGETLEECIVRYGPVVERLPAKVKESDPQACVFSKSGVTIIAEFKGGKAWCHTYRMVAMDEPSVAKLLQAEAEGAEGGWSAPLKLNGQEFRSSADGRRIAVTSLGRKLSDVGILTVANKTYAEANRESYQARLETVSNEVERRVSNQPLKGL